MPPVWYLDISPFDIANNLDVDLYKIIEQY